MISRLTALSAAALVGLTAAACTQQTEAPAADDAADTNTTTVIEREVPVAAPPVVVEREVPVPTPPVVIERDRKGDSTTVRAGENGIEVETTNR